MLPRRTLALILLTVVAAPAAALAADAEAACGLPEPLAGIVDVVAPELALAELAGGGGAMPVLDGCDFLIRPGIRMTSPAGCTMNWVFADEEGALYMGTAGHCLGATGQTGRDVSVTRFGKIGVSVYTLNAGVGADFGLVKIDPAQHDKVDPTLCKWGGPSGVVGDGSPYVGERVMLQYGHGLGYGVHAASRARAFEGNVGHASVSMRGPSAGGDSGSPIMLDTGEAAGVLTHGVGVPVVNFGLGLTYGSRIDVALERAEAALGVDLSLVTSDVPVQLGAGVPFPIV